MKIKFFTNAMMEISGNGFRILCDPWCIPGAFDGSWWHYPPLRTKPEDLTDYTHLYISHIHSDHCDMATLRRLPRKDVPVIILKREGETFLRRRIESCGFHNFVEISDGELASLNGFTVTMYEAFSKSVFVPDAEVPNVIDSSIIVSDGRTIVFNANDNVPTPEVCDKIRERHNCISAALLPYGGIGPYPSSYRNLTLAEKKEAAAAKAERYLGRLVENARTLCAGVTIPCAGQMVLGGRQAHKNEVIGQAEPEAAYERLREADIPSALLWESGEYDTESCTHHTPPPMKDPTYLSRIARERYWWEDAFRIPLTRQENPLSLLGAARERMWRYQLRYGYQSLWTVGIVVQEKPDIVYAFSMNDGTRVYTVPADAFARERQPYLIAEVPYGYLIALLTRHCHWNNGYHGCHIEWTRVPDEYDPDIQTLLSYFHL